MSEFEMLAGKNKSIEKSYEKLRVISQDEKKRMEYEAREKAIRDHNQMMKEAVARGRAEGRAEGLAEGAEQNSIDIARRLLALNYPIDDVAKGTGLSVDRVKALKDESAS